jgi:hypothetical protein
MVIPVLLALLLISDPWSSFTRDDPKVALRNMEAVDRIRLADVYDSTELVKVDGEWRLFGEEPCNQTSVENLLIAAHRLQISSMVSLDADRGPGAEPAPLRRITWFRGDRVLLSFGFHTHESGQYLVHLPGSEHACFVTVSGYPQLKLHKVFSSDPDHYREHLLIDLLPSEISHIGIERSSGEAFGFVQDSLGNIQMETHHQGISPGSEEVNELAIRLLFSYFTSIRYESKSGIAASSLSGPGPGNSPMAAIQVRSFSGESHLLRIYPYRESPGGEAHLFKALVVYDQEPEALFVNYIYLDVLMRGMSHYLGDK